MQFFDVYVGDALKKKTSDMLRAVIKAFIPSSICLHSSSLGRERSPKCILSLFTDTLWRIGQVTYYEL